MKSVLIALLLALFAVAIYAACDANGNGKPNCSGTSSTKYRNNWDPTRYWKCEGNSAISVECEESGFDPKSGNCIPWSEWQWQPVCPDSA